jgi:prepilin-type N-terminal cleavage/methylation domain-containing protein
MSTRKDGFSIIELVIVVAIILVVAAIAIPNLFRSRLAANEGAAIGAVSQINRAEVAYAAAYPNCGFAETLSMLGKSSSSPSRTSAGLIDATLASGSKGGYTFKADGGPGECAGAEKPRETYTVSAQPQSTKIGTRYFFSDQSGVIRSRDGAPANANSVPLQ